MPSVDPNAIAQLPFAAFLILLGLSIGGLGWRQVWVWGRELETSRTSENEWKTIATKMTETNVTQAGQITQLTQSVDLLTKLVQQQQPKGGP